MNIEPHWIGLIGVICGATIASLAPLVSGYASHKRELKLKRRKEKLTRYEEIYQGLSALDAAIHTTYSPSVLRMMGADIPGETKQEEPPDLSKLDMLIGFYAPEIEADYEKIRDKVWHLYGEYVEFVSVFESGNIQEHLKKFIDHQNSWMLLSFGLSELKKKIASHAKEFKL